MKVRALDDNSNHWCKGDIFEAHKDKEGHCYIICHSSRGPTDWHSLQDNHDEYATNPADCPDFEVIQ